MKVMSCRWGVVWGMAALLALAGAAAGNAASLPAAIVRAAAPMTIDGSPADWNGIKAEQPINGRLGRVGSFKLAYDDLNLYALVQVVDPTPLKNGTAIIQELLKGGDAIGLCIGPVGPSRVFHRIMMARVRDKNEIIDMRPHWTDRTNAYTYFTAAGGTVSMDFVDRLAGAQVAFAPVPGGYLAEAKIPWASLGLPQSFKPSPDLRFPFDVQVIFSDPAGTTNVDTSWWHSTGGGPYSTTDLATEARLYPELWGEAQFFGADPGPVDETAAALADPAFTARGLPITFHLPRACKVSVIIRDRNGWIVRELLRARGTAAGSHTIYWDGRDRWGALEPPGDYTYRIGFFDGLKTRFAASAGNSANPPYRTADGLGSIGGMHAGPMAVGAGDGMTMYLLNGGEEGQQSLRKVDLRTGKSLWFHGVGGFGTGQAVAADGQFAYMIYAANNVTSFIRMDPATGHNAAIGPNANPINLGNIETHGLAISGPKAYFSVPKEDRIGVLDLTTGTAGKDIPVKAPTGLCTAGDGSLLVCTGPQVVRLDRFTLDPTPVISGLDAPSAVTTDPAGNIYVAELGKSQQIKKFDAAGKLLAAFGVAGGRGLAAVPYNPMAFRNIMGLAVGPDHNLWAVEQFQPPRRFACLTLDGRWVKDIYGPTRCGDSVGFDLDDVSSIWYQARPTDQGQYINSIWHMNQTGTDENGTPDLMRENNGATGTEYSRQAVFTAANGKRYFWITGSVRCGLWLWEDDRWKAVAAVGGNQTAHYWADKNGDGLVLPDETSMARVDGGWGWIGRDLTLYGLNGSLKPASIDARGGPEYRGGKYTPYLTEKYPDLWKNYFDYQAYGAQMVPGTSDSSVYFSGNNGPHQNRDFWDRTSENRIVKIKDGRVQWMVGHHNGALAENGDELITFGVAGEVDGVVLVSDVGMNFVGYTTDGLALGWALTDENGRPPGVGPNSIYVENAAPGVFIKDPKTGRRLLLTHTSEDVRVLEVTGVFGNEIQRIDGKLTLAQSSPRESQAVGRMTRIPYLTWQNSIYEVWRGTNVDGYDYEWPAAATAIPISDGKTLAGEVRLRRDAGNLCVYADVLDNAPFPAAVTSGVKDPGALFGRNSGVELLMGSGSGHAGRTGPGPGDTRLFFTAGRDADGQLVGQVLACKPASQPIPPSPELSVLDAAGAPRDAGTTKPLDMSAGLTPVPGAMIHVRERLDRRGYAFEAELPIALMPELAHPASVTYFHAGNGDAGLLSRKTRSDLLPVRLNAAIWRVDSTPGGKNGVQRLAWLPDGFSGSDPRTMNPSTWGAAADPLSVSLSIASPQEATPALSYGTTRTSTFSFGSGPHVRVESAIYGGGWFSENGGHFLTTPARDGFTIETGPGIEPVNGNWRTAKLDMSAVGIDNPTSSGQRSDGATPVTAAVKVSFPPGHSGKLHILWGSYTDNSGGGGDLSVKDDTTGQVLDKNTNPEMAFGIGYNADFQARETILSVSGSRTLSVVLRDNGGAQRAVLHGIWIEPVEHTSLAAGSTLSLAAYAGAALAPVRSVEFFANDQIIGEVNAAPYVLAWKPQRPGDYRITARVTNTLGATGTSDVIAVRISVPVGGGAAGRKP